jgi:hypothetical protein
MVKPGSIIGGFIIALSMAMQIITLIEIANYWWLLFIWGAGLIAGITYVLGGLDYGMNKLEYFTTSGIGWGAIISLTVYFIIFQDESILNSLKPLVAGNPWWVLGAVLLSTTAGIMMTIAPLFIVAGSQRQMKDIRPGGLLGGVLISMSLALQIIVVIHIEKFYWLLVFWFIGLIGAIFLAWGAKSKGYNSTEAFVTAGISIGIMLVLVIWWTVSPQMRAVMANASATAQMPPTDPLGPIWATVMSFIAGVVAFFGVSFAAASDTKRPF